MSVQSVWHINSWNEGGGAARVAANLHQAYQQRGIESHLLVGEKRAEVPGTVVLDNKTLLERGSAHLKEQTFAGSWRTAKGLDALQRGVDFVKSLTGVERFDFPGIWKVLDQLPLPDIIHCHNLHDNYFDLRVLEYLSQRTHVVMTLHDEWTFTGHCAYTLGCERWKIGCGACPHLDVYPAVRRDATRFNHGRKAAIYAKSRLHVATPSEWLMDKAVRSNLGYGLQSSRVIPNGVNTRVFRPGAREAARDALELERNRVYLLAVGTDFSRNGFKDFPTILAAARQVAARQPDKPITLLVLGEKEAEKRREGQNLLIEYVPYHRELATVVRLYQACDVFVHAAHNDNFPNTVLEALACGCVVVATEVGGVGEQIRTYDVADDGAVGDATGILVPRADAGAMARAIRHVLGRAEVEAKLRENARAQRDELSLDVQVERYLTWYEAIGVGEA